MKKYRINPSSPRSSWSNIFFKIYVSSTETEKIFKIGVCSYESILVVLEVLKEIYFFKMYVSSTIPKHIFKINNCRSVGIWEKYFSKKNCPWKRNKKNKLKKSSCIPWKEKLLKNLLLFKTLFAAPYALGRKHFKIVLHSYNLQVLLNYVRPFHGIFFFPSFQNIYNILIEFPYLSDCDIV